MDGYLDQTGRTLEVCSHARFESSTEVAIGVLAN
jgi:hypothetical protein